MQQICNEWKKMSDGNNGTWRRHTTFTRNYCTAAFVVTQSHSVESPIFIINSFLICIQFHCVVSDSRNREWAIEFADVSSCTIEKSVRRKKLIVVGRWERKYQRNLHYFFSFLHFIFLKKKEKKNVGWMKCVKVELASDLIFCSPWDSLAMIGIGDGTAHWSESDLSSSPAGQSQASIWIKLI